MFLSIDYKVEKNAKHWQENIKKNTVEILEPFTSLSNWSEKVQYLIMGSSRQRLEKDKFSKGILTNRKRCG